MSYTPTEWKAGDTVTSAKLNKLEQGVASAGGGSGILIVTETDGTLDKTWKEIHNALASGTIVAIPESGTDAFLHIAREASVEEGNYSIFLFETGMYFTTDSENGYPTVEGLPK